MSVLEYMKDPGWKYLRQSDDERLAAQSKPYDSKVDCWIPDAEDGFVTGKIQSTKGDEVTVKSAKGSDVKLKADQVQEMNPPKFDKVEDMSNLSFLNDASVLGNLRSRYEAMLIYTYSGLFCVVVNPYKRLPIYTDSVAKMYIGKRKNEMPPHLWANADEAFRNMMQDRENQSMLITGESGAGKTENTKKVIAYFAVVGASQSGPVDPDAPKKVSLEEQIVQTNPILEAFGNAKTVRNNNSSRFGKFIRIHFSKDAKVAGCDIEHYLLEKSRVVRQAPGERCYHVFYFMYTSDTLRKTLGLSEPLTYYHSVSQAELTVPGIDDTEEFMLMDEAFDILNFSGDEKLDCYKMMSAIMHMGEMKFKQKARSDQAEPDGEDEAKWVGEMMGVDPEKFVKALCSPKVRVGTEWVAKGQNLEQVNWAVGAMSKGIYARIFDWLVEKCNLTLDAKEHPRAHFIGVLDIAGFEIFDMNSFEQLWINFVNEKLQQFFNHHMFVLEQEEYKREGIDWVFVDFGMDLAACIELIEKPMGIIAMLDEECIVPKATDLTLAQKLTDQHLGKHPNFEKPKPPKGKQSEAHFAMKHYAGLVRYNVMNWLEKNKDPLNDTCVSVMKNNEGNDLCCGIWGNYETQEEAAAKQKEDGGKGGGKKKGKSASMMTVSALYRESLNKLINMLNATHPHFVRCLIPNELKKSGMMDAALVMNQLTCNGVLEGIRICRKGFPNRLQHADFKIRYSLLAADAAKASPDPKDTSANILGVIVKKGDLVDDNFRVGKTKVFFKAGILAAMEDLRDARLTEIMLGMQSFARWNCGLIDRKRRTEQAAGRKIVARNVKAWCTLRTWEWFVLYGKSKALSALGKDAEILAALEEKLKELETTLAREESQRKELAELETKLEEEKIVMYETVERELGGMMEADKKITVMEAAKEELTKTLASLEAKVSSAESGASDMARAKKQAEQTADSLKKQIQDSELSVRKVESERQSKDHQIRSLQEEMTQQEEVIAKVNKEKKHQEEVNRKLTEDLQAQEDKVNHLNKVKGKLETSQADLDDSLEREKRSRQETEKAKRKLEGELKIALENIDELSRQRQDAENSIKKKDMDMSNTASRLDDEQSQGAKLARQLKELQGRLGEIEEELEAERSARSKADRSRSELQREMEELADRLDEAGGATSAQQEMNKKREAELAKLRRELDESNMGHENSLTALRQKHNQAVAELGDQLDQLNKQKSSMDKDKAQIVREVEELQAACDSEAKAKANAEKIAQAVEVQLQELQAKTDDQSRQLQDFTSLKNRLGNDQAELDRQLEEAEAQLGNLHRVKSQLSAQLEEARRAGEDEARERSSLQAQLKNFQNECDNLRVQNEEEQEAKADTLRQLSKASAETQQWRSRFESEGLAKAEELEEAKRKLNQKLSDIQEQIDAANAKALGLERSKNKIVGELDDAQVDVERANVFAATLEKKQKGFDRVVEEWHKKTDDLASELDAAQRDARNAATEVFRLKNMNEELGEQMEGLRRENKNLAQEIKDLSDQLGEGGRSIHEMQKMVRRLEVEKDELQTALDEAESALEAEESKVLRAQVEVSQIRSEIEKRIQEKEEEFENTRKNHQRALDSMQASLESEAKGRAELLRVKKNLESDINELEINLDHANKANADAQHSIKKHLEQIRELQMSVEEEQRYRDELRDSFHNAEKRASMLSVEKDELMHGLENSDRGRKQAEYDAHEGRDQANDLAVENSSLQGMKRKLDSEMQAIHADLEETLNELRASEERSKKAMGDAARIAEELRQEQEHSVHIERMRKGLEETAKAMQARLEEAEAAALKGGKKMIAKLEGRLRDVETELDGEQRRHQDSVKNLAKADRRQRELQFQIDEDKKNADRMQDLADKLQQKIKTYKRQVEEAEELANTNLAKYRQLAHQLEDAEERADAAENSVAKIRSKSRAGTMAPGGLATSSSFVRSPSRLRTTASAMDLDFS